MCPSGQGLVSENGPSGPWPGLLPGEYGRHTAGPAPGPSLAGWAARKGALSLDWTHTDFKCPMACYESQALAKSLKFYFLHTQMIDY